MRTTSHWFVRWWPGGSLSARRVLRRVRGRRPGKVANLNADKVDGKDDEAFLAANGKAQDAAHADRADTAANADALDGRDSSAFYAAGSKVADSTHADRADWAADAQTLLGRSVQELSSVAQTPIEVASLHPSTRGAAPARSVVCRDRHAVGRASLSQVAGTPAHTYPWLRPQRAEARRGANQLGGCANYLS